MPGEKNLQILLKNMQPKLNAGEYVFCIVHSFDSIETEHILLFFKETEGITIILRKEIADQYGLAYSFVAAWITLKVHSALEAVGLTAAFSTALTKEQISCNVVAAYYHDHIFVDMKDARKTIEILNQLSGQKSH